MTMNAMRAIKAQRLGLLIGASLLFTGCATDGDAESHASNDADHAMHHDHDDADHDHTAQDGDTMSFYDFDSRTLEGEPIALSEWKGRVALVVNVASECGLTPQYTELQKLFDEYSTQGFTVLAFPSNDFGGQEPGSAEEIRMFCTDNYSVSFPMFEKVQTKSGEGQSPIYAMLEDATGQLPEWNFSKYLIARDGASITYFGPRTAPNDDSLREAIEIALAEAIE